jgi:hypothetical protein
LIKSAVTEKPDDMAQDRKRQNFDNFVCVFRHASERVQCQDGQKDYQEKVSYVFQEVACQKQGFFNVFFVVHNSHHDTIL